MIMHLSTKGQVTIPQAIREELGIGPGAAVDIKICDGGAFLQPVQDDAPSATARSFIERLRGSATIRMTTDEIMALTRGED